MPSRQSFPPSDRTTAFDEQGGCLSGFILPPLAVILVGALLVFVWLSVSPGTTTAVLAAGPEMIANPGLQTEAPTQAPLQEIPSIAPASGETAGSAPSPASGEGAALSTLFRPEVQYWNAAILDWAASSGIDPNLIATVIQIESCGNPFALSRAGALGLFQVMPDHFNGAEDPYLPSVNAERGLAYLKKSLEVANGDIRLALAGYNGGTSVIAFPESSWPAETQRYAYWGSGIYAEASAGAAESLRLDEWMSAGGSSLCRQARYRLGINP